MSTQRFEDRIYTDVLVIGGGLAGVCSAISAARNGCKVVLVEKSRTLGGNSGPKAGVHPSGSDRFHPYTAEVGIIGEIMAEAAFKEIKTKSSGHHYNIAMQWDSLLYNKMIDAGVIVMRGHCAMEPIVEDDRISSVKVIDTACYKERYIFIEDVVIESSGDAHIGAKAGAQWRMGREGRDEYNEDLAPKVADDITMGSSVVALIRKSRYEVNFVPPDGTPEFFPGYGGDLKGSNFSGDTDNEIHFFFPVETGGHLNTLEDDHEIYEMAKSKTFSAWNEIKNVLQSQGSQKWEMVWMSPDIAKRESRRLIGDYVLNGNDVANGRIFDDAIAYGGFAVDIHYPKKENIEYVKIVYFCIPPLYTIPYRSIYSKNIDNLLIASRCISVSHIAHGSTRLQKTLSIVGQAAGVAASLCKKYKISPREVGEKHIKQLREILTYQDSMIPGATNDRDDNIARNANVSATSSQKHGAIKYSSLEKIEGIKGIQLWDWASEIKQLKIYVKNNEPNVATISFDFMKYKSDRPWQINKERKIPEFVHPKNEAEWGFDNRVEAFTSIKSNIITIDPLYEGWVSIDINEKMPVKDMYNDDDRYMITFNTKDNIALGEDLNEYPYAKKIVGLDEDNHYIVEPNTFMFQLEPSPIYCESENVINGINRRFSSNPMNMWKPSKKLPQSITLEFDECTQFNEIKITFDTISRAYRQMPGECRKKVLGNYVKKYQVFAYIDDDWTLIDLIDDNYKRVMTHNFNAIMANKIKLTILETWDMNELPGVYDISAFCNLKN